MRTFAFLYYYKNDIWIISAISHHAFKKINTLFQRHQIHVCWVNFYVYFKDTFKDIHMSANMVDPDSSGSGGTLQRLFNKGSHLVIS